MRMATLRIPDPLMGHETLEFDRDLIPEVIEASAFIEPEAMTKAQQAVHKCMMRFKELVKEHKMLAGAKDGKEDTSVKITEFHQVKEINFIEPMRQGG
jgi:hypothetical protein